MECVKINIYADRTANYDFNNVEHDRETYGNFHTLGRYLKECYTIKAEEMTV